MIAAAVLLAAALLVDAGPTVVRARAGRLPRTQGPRRRLIRGTDPLAVASSLDVFAVCLQAGMAVSAAAAATAVSAPPALAAQLSRAADLLALGADPSLAWSPAPDLPAGDLDAQTDALLRLARRSASSGRRWLKASSNWRLSPGMTPCKRRPPPPSAPGCSSRGRWGCAFCRPLSASALCPWWRGWPVRFSNRGCYENGSR